MISVLLPVYNAERYLPECVDSVLGQTFTDFEVIAVNDGSTDHSLAILEAYAVQDARLKVISRPNTGIVGALNDGLAASRGEFVARMDADDYAYPYRFEKQLDFLRSHSDCVACGTAVHFTDPQGRPVKPCPRPLTHDSIVSSLLDGDGGALIHPSIMFRRDAVVSLGAYRECAQWIEDLDLYLRLSECGQLANLPDYLLNYRQHPQSVNATKSDAMRWESKNAVMKEAHANRGSHWAERESWPLLSAAELHREWACESLGYGNWRVSLEHAFHGLWAEPAHRSSWRVLKYVAGRGRAIASHAKQHPSERYGVQAHRVDGSMRLVADA